MPEGCVVHKKNSTFTALPEKFCGAAAQRSWPAQKASSANFLAIYF
jgi:hypothetical protein